MIVQFIERAGGRILAGIPNSVLRAVAPKIVDETTGYRLDPDVAISLLVLRMGGDFSDLEVPAARELIDSDAKAGAFNPIEVGSVEDTTVAGVRVRIYTPEGAAGETPAVVYAHGGGWVLGSLDSHDITCRYFCANAGVRVINVDYALAPEHKAPAGLNDVTAVLKAALDGEVAGADPTRVVMAGDSAGGNLTAAACLELAAAGQEQMPVLQMMFAPVTDLARAFTYNAGDTYDQFEAGFYLTRKQMRWYAEHYLEDLADIDAPNVSVINADPALLAKTPPAYVAVAGFDVLRQEGIDYARLLAKQGVEVTLAIHTRVVHPFVNAFDAWSSSREAVETAVAALKRAVG